LVQTEFVQLGLFGFVQLVQSWASLQPHWYTLEISTQPAPTFVGQPVQSKQAPDEPQVDGALPATHAFPEQQNPPLQLPLPRAPHWLVHAYVVPEVFSQVGVPSLQAVHRPPFEPQAAFEVPATQAPSVAPPGTRQQPPLQAWLALQVVVHWLVLVSHAKPAGQSLALTQPHSPLVQASPTVFPVQSSQTPLVPQAVSAVPTLQDPLVAAEQQPPLQVWVESQSVTQTLVLESQARPAVVLVAAGQSVVELQPQDPLVRQTFPTVPAVQSTQTPLAPQAVSATPALQVPPVAAEQQPVEHGVVELQDRRQRWAVVSQLTAVLGQFVLELHPHCPPPEIATQMFPAVPAVNSAGQSEQAPPLLPHAALAVPTTQVPLWQQPVLQVWVALQVVVHLLVLVSQA
jgi:hypothetical protein